MCRMYRHPGDGCKKVVLPARPTIDKVICFALWFRKLGRRPDQLELELHLEQHPVRATWERWAREKAAVYDIAERKYQQANEGSCTQMFVNEEGTTDTRILELARIADLNNETGFLKEMPNSLAFILREMYKMDYKPEEVVRAVADAVLVWLEARMRPSYDGRTKETLEQEEGLKPLLDQAVRHFGDFTISGYILDMWLCGRPVDEIIDRACYFLDSKKEATAENLNLQDAWERTYKRFFAGGGAVVLRTRDTRLPRWVFKNRRQFQLVISRRWESDPRKRGVAIMTRNKGCDLKRLAGILYLLEGNAQTNLQTGKWFFDERINALLNGSDGHGVPATYLGDRGLEDLVELFVFRLRQLETNEIPSFADRLLACLPPVLQSRIDRQRLLELLWE